jgi:hypothetical protein
MGFGKFRREKVRGRSKGREVWDSDKVARIISKGIEQFWERGEER